MNPRMYRSYVVTSVTKHSAMGGHATHGSTARLITIELSSKEKDPYGNVNDKMENNTQYNIHAAQERITRCVHETITEYEQRKTYTDL